MNEQIEALAERVGLAEQELDLVCECGDASCTQRIRMTHAEYEALRSDARTFAVVPGHAIGDVEVVVDRRGGYDVVRKQVGEAAAVAEQTDARTAGTS